VRPVIQAILIADKVYEDKSTGKKIIAGTFDRIIKMPDAFEEREDSDLGEKTIVVAGGMHAGSPYAYISVTNIRSSVDLSIQYVELADNSVLLQTKVSVNCADPLASVEIVAPLPPLPTPHPGVYALEVLCEGDLIGSYRVTVIQMEGKRDG